MSGHPRHKGTSPLTRGKPRALPRPADDARNIPAHAGKTRSAAWEPTGTGGTSPLTRGKRPLWHFNTPRPRNIPAHAGKTRSVPVDGGADGEHPRSRGENRVGSPRIQRRGGTSPLTRGKLSTPPPAAPPFWNIPAHAGKTLRTGLSARRLTEHPRSRGENNRRRWRGWSLSGTSPLTRGKRNLRRPALHRARNIPAHAGKTMAVLPIVHFLKEHPRSRGENSLKNRESHPGAGTSPLTRGKLPQPRPGGRNTGNIPAHAGKTRTPRRLGRGRWEHPRSRGENRQGGSNSEQG